MKHYLLQMKSKHIEFCIMPSNPPIWYNHRMDGLVRHECIYGTANRKKSIEDGLVIFLRPELHNMSNAGVHFNKRFDTLVKQVAESAWLEHYGKTQEDFIKRFGRNYL